MTDYPKRVKSELDDLLSMAKCVGATRMQSTVTSILHKFLTRDSISALSPEWTVVHNLWIVIAGLRTDEVAQTEIRDIGHIVAAAAAKVSQ